MIWEGITALDWLAINVAFTIGTGGGWLAGRYWRKRIERKYGERQDV